jgi:hypothetical protein
MTPFYYATLEQYYTGELILQEINGVDDGSLVYIAFCFISAIYGCKFWSNEISFMGLPSLKIVYYIMYVLFSNIFIALYQK